AFALAAVPLTEGENTILAIATSKNGGTTSASARVIADRTPPALRILESGQPLSDQARFAASAALAIEVSDAREVRRLETRLDGAIIALPLTVTAQGGHAIIAVAADSAGNETRAEGTFFIGGASAVGCSLGTFVPASGSIVALSSTGLTGRTGGAAGVKVNGVPASVAKGSFCATVELPVEGANHVEIVCVDAAGNAIGKPSAITLVRSTSLPSVTIDAPEEGAATDGATLRVSGTAGPGVVDVTVNGAAAILAPGDPSAQRAYSLEGVRLSPGMNVLLVRAKTAAGRAATVSRRVIRLADAPALTITSPLPGQVVGSASGYVSGLWSGIDPATLSVTGTAASAEIAYSGDRSGSFLVRDIPLGVGENALTISARDVRGRAAIATVAVRRDDSAPAVQITAPLDNAIFGAATSALAVTGTATAANGATIEIGGHPATIVSSEAISESRTRYTFSGSMGFADLGLTPVVARVTEPSGRSVHHAIRVTRLASPPTIEQVFPASNAAGVDPGAMAVVVFSNPMDRTSLRCGGGEACAFRLESPSGSALSGVFDVDRDALTFAPAAPLEEGVEYTLRIGTAAKDTGGVALASEYVSRFRVGLAAAPSAAPLLDALPTRYCGTALTIAGSAPAGARIQLDVGSSKFLTAADGSGRFRYDAPLTGEAGYLLLRARTIGSDGSLSAAAHACVLIDCGGLGVSAASFDRTVNTLTISFTAPVDVATATAGDAGAIRLRLKDNRIVGGGVSLANSTTLSITPAENLRETSFTLEVTTAIRGTDGTPLSAPFSQPFIHDSGESGPGDGTGFVSGEVYDASTGRPLRGASVAVAVPVNAFDDPTTIRASANFGVLSDARGRYAVRLPEGAHALHAAVDGFTSAWRQVIVPAGGGITPIDIRLAKRAKTATIAALPVALVDGGEDEVTTRASLEIPPGSIGAGARVTLTSVGGQSLAGLLPLGWSPLGSAEIVVSGGELAAATLSFDVPAAEVTAAAKPLSLALYDRDRDEWRVLVPAVNVTSGRASAPIAGAGDYALVYADGTTPSLAVGAALPAASDPCATTQCPPLTSTSFVLEPEMVLPEGIATATLVVDGSVPFPSGTAVQAWIDEELRLADGSSLLEPPFAADLVLYRSLDGKVARASFHLAPSPRAAQVILESGLDHVRVRPYPGRLARGTLVGPEGGRVPSDGDVAMEIPAGASPEPIRASASSLPPEEIAALGAVAGFRVLGGVAFDLERASATPPGEEGGDAPAVVLLAPARLTIRVGESLPAAAQVVVAEVLGDTAFGRVVRVAARAVPVPFEGGATLLTTAAIDRSVLSLDGVVREGRYLVLAAEAPIAYATGGVRRGATGAYVDGALVTAPPLGVADLTRKDGEFVIPVLAAPASPFTVVPRHGSIGEGTPRAAASAPEEEAIVELGDVLLESQPPQVASTVPQHGATGVSLTTAVRVQFDRAVDPSSLAADSIAVTGSAGAIAGIVTADGAGAILWTLSPGTSLRAGAVYTARVAPTVRSAAGAPLGRAFSFSFETLAEMRSDEVRAERISITIPTAAGVSTIRGRAGALPAGWQALAARRGRDFVTRYQATAGADGSFSFVAGTTDPISIADLIDLHVVNGAGSVAAVLPLTPFVTDDAKGFIARPYEPTEFTSADGIGVSVPADAFDGPVMVTVEPAQKETLAGVPNLDAELRWSGSVEMRLDCLEPDSSSDPCLARERIDIELPVPAGADPAGRIFLLGALGHSVRGPRLMIVDTLRVDGDRFTIARATTEGASVVSADSVLVNADAKQYLAGVNRSGVYSVVDASVPAGSSFGWSLMDVTGGAYDLFNSTFASLYASSAYLAESRGRIAIPILTNKEFTISGYDAATGLKAFEKVYEPNPVGDPGAVFLLSSPVADASGPYPVFGTPFRIDALQVGVEGVDLEAIPNFTIRLEGGFITAADAAGSVLPPDVTVALMNPA
ncbi:MAG TPA: Ig-like domain-containing protein, partial [Thermoanaerobaculia bacterium]|nr:Ig-like domain-containing protein [Thermoanaerobaculia bacterium]